MAELLTSVSAWATGNELSSLRISSSSLRMPIRGEGAPEVLEVALLVGPSSQRKAASAPVHFMGGGPRTYPGGVTKWQWKRMQLKKSRQMEKARLMRERHVYEARRRAELIAASPILEMPWQKMSRVRPSNYVSADEQITKLAARFHKPGAEDLWTENDGPDRFEGMDDKEDHFERPSSSWFSNTVAHSQDGNQDSGQDGSKDTETRSHFQSLRQMPRIRPGSTPYAERYPGTYQRRQWRPSS